MEDLKKLLEQNEDYLLSSSSEKETDDESSLSAWDLKKYSDDDSFSKNYVLEIKCSNSITSNKRNGEKRLPTRRPDPNVYNRNALLARENRRKKKAYLETIEKELQFARKANNALVKALKRQLKIAQRLEKEKKYYEGLFANRSDILNLVNALNFRCIPVSSDSPNSTFSSNADLIQNVMRSTTSLSSNLNDADALSIQFDSPSDDFDSDKDNLPSTSTTWDDIWGVNGVHIDNLISPESTLMQDKSCIQSINDDHCYVMSSSLGSFQSPKKHSENSDYVDVEGDSSEIGIFCSSNWDKSCRTPPLQLLSDQTF
ncbi:uncharacterized protein LOC111688752 [Lucilia cuprina]|uniref:uncharacterized protein LOC111688752 n=1 Tax=Lucilia cuprina TaxID=7375 RepID=UPI001F060711|nr:uncharacterized protein LOC111688752 [Lucilia cuprina]XP_046805641.1 uncharacterized protein LOC111688752 [Lucilia cuprina]